MLLPDKLNLTIPRSWNECTPEQLETIASVMIEFTMRSTVLQHYNSMDVKVAIFFALSRLEVLEPANPRTPVEEQYYVCRHPNYDGSFNLYLWQLHYWIYGDVDVDDYKEEEKKKPEKERKRDKRQRRKNMFCGLLDWIDSPDSQGLLLFPYVNIRRIKYVIPFKESIEKRIGKKFQGPSALMQDFTWQRYRFAQDYMSYYLSQSNRLVMMKKYHRRFSQRDVMKQEKNVDLARAMFLATIFCGEVTLVDEGTKHIYKDYAYISNQHVDNAQYFRHFPDVQWQVVLFWWSGQMRDLQRVFPRCFKVQDVKKGQQTNALEVYTRTTATMEKYLSMADEKVNLEPYRNILQHLEDMSKESEELDKIRKKNNTKTPSKKK